MRFVGQDFHQLCMHRYIGMVVWYGMVPYNNSIPYQFLGWWMRNVGRYSRKRKSWSHKLYGADVCTVWYWMVPYQPYRGLRTVSHRRATLPRRQGGVAAICLPLRSVSSQTFGIFMACLLSQIRQHITETGVVWYGTIPPIW